MFVCPVCGSDSYSLSMRVRNAFKCNKCSIVFESPLKFGRINNKKDITVIEDSQGVHISMED